MGITHQDHPWSYVNPLGSHLWSQVLSTPLGAKPCKWSQSCRRPSTSRTMDVDLPCPLDTFGTTCPKLHHASSSWESSSGHFSSFQALKRSTLLAPYASQDPSLLHHTRARSSFHENAPMCLDDDPCYVPSHRNQIGHASCITIKH